MRAATMVRNKQREIYWRETEKRLRSSYDKRERVRDGVQGGVDAFSKTVPRDFVFCFFWAIDNLFRAQEAVATPSRFFAPVPPAPQRSSPHPAPSFVVAS